jgi:hypothetical protein
MRERRKFSYTAHIPERRMKLKLNEKDIVNQICGKLKTIPRCYYFRTHGNVGNFVPSRKGIPDIIGWYRGRPFGIEVKRTDKAVEDMRQAIEHRNWPIISGLSNSQRAQCGEIVAIQESGGIGIVTNNTDDVEKALGISRELRPLFEGKK